jgi:predicted CoA-binding protein
MLDIDFSHSDKELRQILKESSAVAVVGESNDHYYASYQVAQYLMSMGYKVYPVNQPLTRWTARRVTLP